MSPENECSRFKQNAWKKELCSNCFRPREEHPEKPKRVHVDYKPLPDISPAQSILKVVNGSCDKTRNVSFSNVESEVIGYGGEEYSTDEEYSSDDDRDGLTGWTELSGDDEEELKRLTDANTNLNGKPTIACSGGKVVVHAKQLRPATKSAPIAITPAPATAPADNNNSNNATTKSPSPPLVVVQPFGGEHATKSLVFNFLKNKEMAAAAQRSEKKEATTAVQLRKPSETTKKPSLTRSSLTANSNEQFLNMKRCSLQPAEERADKPAPASVEIPKVKLHPPETTVMAAAVGDKCAEDNDDEASAQAKESADPTAPYKTRSNVPRMGTMHFKLKLAVASSQKPDAPKPAAVAAADSTPDSSLTSREMAGEPDGKADSDEPCDPTTAPSVANVPVNRSSFLHNFKTGSPPPRDTTTPPRTPSKKTSISSANNSPPECPRSTKRQAPKPPPPTPPPSATKCTEPAVHGRQQQQQQQQQQLPYPRRRISSSSESGPDEVTVANRKLLAEYCEQIEKEQLHRGTVKESSPVEVGDVPRESATLPLPNKRPVYEKKKYGKAGRVGLKIKKFLRIPGRDLISGPTTPPPPPRPKLEIIHPLDINKSAVEIIHNAAEGMMQLCGMDSSRGPINHYAARPTKPPPPPRSLPPAAKHSPPKSSKSPKSPADRADGASSRTCDSNSSSSNGSSNETTAYEPVNFSAPECDHLHGCSPDMARLTSVQYCGSETESDIYPAIRFADDFGAEDSIRNTRPGHKSLEESYDAVVVANHEALTKLLDQATCGGPRVPKDLLPLKSKALRWSSFRVDPTSRLRKSGCAFYNARWNDDDVPVVLSVSRDPVRLNNVLNNHFTLTKVTEFATRVQKELSPPGVENHEAHVTLWNAHRVESVESYCAAYNAEHADVTKEAGLVLVETVNLLMGLQAADVRRYSLDPFVVTRNGVGAEPSVAVVQLAADTGVGEHRHDDALCDVMLNVLGLLAPAWEMTVCLSQVLRQDRPNSLAKCKALLELWLWGPTGATVTPDRPLSLKSFRHTSSSSS